MAYRSLTINDDDYPVDAVAITHTFDSVTEPKAQRDGMEAYESHKINALIRIDGFIRGTSVADMHDKIEALNAAFDPVVATEADDSDFDIGFWPFTFSVPTANTDDYATGLIPMQYYARAMQLPVDRVSKFEGHSTPYTILLMAIDPRRYLQTTESEVRTNAGAMTLDNSLAKFSSWPTVTIALTGAGQSKLTLQRVADADTRSLVLNLSSYGNGDEIVIDMERRQITVDGASAMGSWDSGDFWWLAPESQTLNVTNTTGTLAGTVTVEWRRAFP